MSPRRVAVIHDWLDTWGGGENVLAEVLQQFPDADLFALVDFFSDDMRGRIGGKRAHTSFLQHVPGARRHFRKLLPLFPRAIEAFDLRGYDLVLSLSHAVAKGVRTTSSQLHVCYCFTPMRYAWDLREDYLRSNGIDKGLRGRAAHAVLDRMREWDRKSSSRVNHFIAISSFVRERIARSYGRDAEVIYPPVDTDFFAPGATAKTGPGYFVTASRHVPYKRIDLIVTAFNALPGHRLIVAGAGPESARLRNAAGPNVEFVGEVSREQLRTLLQNAHAFVFAAEEDFGILPLEAQACGTPVIALRRGGAIETVRGIDAGPAATGVFYDEQSGSAIASAVAGFDTHASMLSPQNCRAQALRFSAPRFREEFTAAVDGYWRDFTADKG